MKVKVISLPYIFQVLYVLCFTRPRYQVSVYRTIGPLVCFCLFGLQIQIQNIYLTSYTLYVHDKQLRSYHFFFVVVAISGVINVLSLSHDYYWYIC